MKRYVVEGALIQTSISITVANAVIAAVLEVSSVVMAADGCTAGNLLCNGTCIDENIDDNNCGKSGNVCIQLSL